MSEIIKRIDEHLEFHETILSALDKKTVFRKQHDRHKSDIAFLETIRAHIMNQNEKIHALEMQVQGRNPDGSLIPSESFLQANE